MAKSYRFIVLPVTLSTVDAELEPDERVHVHSVPLYTGNVYISYYSERRATHDAKLKVHCIPGVHVESVTPGE